ncbi:cytochrome P450 72A397-like [Nymphaea colorata]|nr:cytochrome P450 72A397-like [Nymphaea colorata]
MAAAVLLLLASVALFLSWVVVKTVYSVWWKPRQYAEAFKRQGIHGYPYKLLVGNIKEAATMQEKALAKPMAFSHDIAPRVGPFFKESVDKHGRISLTWFGKTPQLILQDPEMVKEVLSNKFGHFSKAPQPAQVKMLAWGLANLNGEQWAVQRRRISPVFHLEKLKGMLPSFSTSCSELVQRWEKSISPKGSCELDVWNELQNLTGDVISRTAFGSNYDEGKQIFQMQKEQAELVIQAIRRIYIPGSRFLPTKENKRQKELNRKVISLLNNIIEKREKEMQLGIAKNDDLLGILLESNKSHREHGDKGMTRKEVIEECKLFYFAGQETTSVLLTWTMVLLSMYPSWQMHAREEVLQVCGKNIPSFDSLSHLKTVTMILNEVLRLYPPATFIVRYTYKTVKLGDLILPEGVRLILPLLLIHHDHKLWGDDAEEFKPERFSEGIANASKNQLAFLPFGWGPRICIGQTFALIEAKMALAMILQRFSFELSPTYAHAPRQIITLQPQHGAQIILHSI